MQKGEHNLRILGDYVYLYMEKVYIYYVEQTAKAEILQIETKPTETVFFP